MRVHPLSVRPGARFACFGDGLCCTDVHALGPVRPEEAEVLRLISPEVVVHEPRADAGVLVAGSDGRCMFRVGDGCALHASLGEAGKPHSCRLFPYGVTATPTGGRITTDHRCPCRTLGDRPLVSVEAVEPVLRGPDGVVRAQVRAPERIRLDARRTLPFAEWEHHEAALRERLAAFEDPSAVIGGGAFPELEDASWHQVAIEMLDAGAEGASERGYETRFEAALGWFGAAVLALRAPDAAEPPPDRPWADAFDRAEARSPAAADPAETWADFVADELWALRWAADRSLAGLGAELGTRLAVGRHVAATLEAEGARPDRAAAEGVMVIELVGTSDWWTEVRRRMRT